MKLAFLVQCHKAPEQVNALLTALDHPNVTFFIHVDKKSNIGEKILQRENVHLLPGDLRVDVRWGELSQVYAAINLLSYALQRGEFDYYWQISGQDFPTVSPQKMLDFLMADNGRNYINLCNSRYAGTGKTNAFDKRTDIYYPTWMAKRTLLIKALRVAWVKITGGKTKTHRIFKRKAVDQIRPCFGSCWWCLHTDFVSYGMAYIENHPEFSAFFKHSLCPDEAFFQTLFMGSPYAETQAEYLHYIDWSGGGSSPKFLGVSDYDAIVQSKKFMARKIDADFELIARLTAQLDDNAAV